MPEELTKLRFLLLSLWLLVAPHFFHLHPSHTLLFLALWCWRWLGLSRPHLMPSGNFLAVLTLASALVVLLAQRGAFDLTTSTGLFVAGLGLKLMELKTPRDLYFVVSLGWLVALIEFLHDQSLKVALYEFAALSLLTAAQLQLNSVGHLPRRALVAQLACLLLPALPLAVGLFLLFPRPQGGFVHLPFATHAKTGLAEILVPGAISHLAASSEIALRVDFEGDMPPPKERYFRAQVFWRFDGHSWHPHPAMQQKLPEPPPGIGKRYVYQLTVEPHQRRWLFSLGLPANAPPGAHLTREGGLKADFPVEKRIRYRLTSFSAWRFPPLSPLERALALQLPEPPSAKIQDLVNKLRPPSGKPEEFARAVLAYFRTQGFRYTLHPGPLGARPIEEFLFSTRAGFCEHYASAFAYLMRAAGVPARIVGGYLGGFVNPRGGFLEVYQANAHAWVEIWVESQGWIRVDPTEAVAPQYLEQAQNLPSPLNPALPALKPEDPFSTTATQGQASLWRRLVHNALIFWSDLEHRWHLWVLSYDATTQAALLAYLAKNWPKLMLLLGGLLGLLAMRARRCKADPLLLAYQEFLGQMARQGLIKAPWESPYAFAQRVAAQMPNEAWWVYRLTEAFLRARYGRRRTLAATRAIWRLQRARKQTS